ncbi:MAG: restriction endonuclease subunit S [Patescibacteria group bacterium]
MKNNQKNIPDGWQAIKLSSIFEFKNGLNKEKTFFGHGTPIINYMDINRGGGLYEDNIHGRVDVNKSELDRFNVKKGDVFFTRTSETLEEIGFSAVALDDFQDTVFSGFVLRARPKGQLLIPNFAQYCFKAQTARKEIMEKSSYTTRALTSGTLLNHVNIALPPSPEQNRIVAVLEAWDRAIEKLKKKIEIKKQVKKGLMQELLTGKTRLPGFQGDWHTVELQDICSINMGQSPPSAAYNENGDGLPLIQGNNDIKERKTVVRIWTNQITKTGDKGDIVMTVRAPVGWIGVATEKVCLGRGICSIKSKNSDPSFVLKLLESYESRWKSLEQGSTFSAVNSSDIKSLSLFVPKSRDEQGEIANILVMVDSEIGLLNKERIILQNQKKYLLNNLITGAIRTPETLKVN